jgi:hypothetical protein
VKKAFRKFIRVLQVSTVAFQYWTLCLKNISFTWKVMLKLVIQPFDANLLKPLRTSDEDKYYIIVDEIKT